VEEKGSIVGANREGGVVLAGEPSLVLDVQRTL